MSGSAIDLDALFAEQDRYYERTLSKHGATPQGVDWNSREAQEGRFEQLVKVCVETRFSIVDYGCGYGALADYLTSRGLEVDYTGFDVSDRMIELARESHKDSPSASFTSDEAALEPADYVVASGLLNLKLDIPDDSWQDYAVGLVERFDALSLRGFAFNMLTKYSDPEHMRADLHYGDPCFFFDLCKRRFSRHVALLHDYGFYEFTIIVRK